MPKLIDISKFGLRHAENSLIEKIVDFASSEDFDSDLDKAATIYWQVHKSSDFIRWDDPDSPLWLEEDGWEQVDALTARFHDWFLFDYRLSSGLRMVETFFQACVNTLNRYERQLLEHWVTSYFGVFIINRISGTSLRLKDILDDSIVEVTGEDDDSFGVGDLIAGRPLALGDSWRMSGAIMTIKANHGLTVMEGLKSRYNRLLSVSPGITVPQFYRLCGHLLDSLIGKAMI